MIHYHWIIGYRDKKTGKRMSTQYHFATSRECRDEFNSYLGKNKNNLLEYIKFELDPLLHRGDSIEVLIDREKNKTVKLESVINKMDAKIRDSLIRLGLLRDPQLFLDAYKIAHSTYHSGDEFK